jgi:multiple sugar transport system substrate-binding protein
MEENLMFKKIFRTLIITGLIFTILVSCTTATTAPTQQPTAVPATAVVAPTETTAPVPVDTTPVKVMMTWPDYPEMIKAFFDGYTAETGIPVEVNSAVPLDKIIAALSSEDAPDLLVLGDIYSVGMFAAEGLITPLDDYIAQNQIDTSDMYTGPREECNYSGNYYCLPWGTDAYALYWNKGMFEEAGLDPDVPPETMEQMLEYSDKLTKTDADGNLTQVGFIPDFPWMHTELYLAMFGSTYQNAEGTKVQLDTPEMIATMKWQQEFYTRYGADKVSRFLSSAGNYLGADSGFYTNKIAMVVDGEWQTGPEYLQKYRPDMDYGIAPMPYPEAHPEYKNTVVLWGTVVEIPTNAANKDGAAKLLAWMELPKNQTDMMIILPNLPSSHAASADPRFQQNIDLKLFIDMMNNGKAQPVYVSAYFYDILTAVYTIQEQVLLGGEDPVPLLTAANAEIQGKMDGTP